jgi:multidrug transporter EmrE-like cation transporter
LIGFILLALCVLFSALASIFLKMGVSALTQPSSFLALVLNPMIWIGGIFYAAAFLGYIYVLRLVPLSLAQPVITAGVSAVTAVVAVMFFREQMLLTNWFGLVLICTGIFFLFLGRA